MASQSRHSNAGLVPLASFAAALLASCGGSPVAGPAHEPERPQPHPGYPDAEWITGRGRSRMSDMARAMAQSDLTKGVERAARERARSYAASCPPAVSDDVPRWSARALVRSTGLTFTGIEMAEVSREADGGAFIALAVLNRAQAEAEAGERARSHADALARASSSAEDCERQGDAPAAAGAYRAAIREWTELLLARALQVELNPGGGMRIEVPDVVPLEEGYVRNASATPVMVAVFQLVPGSAESACDTVESRLFAALKAEGLKVIRMDDSLRARGYVDLKSSTHRLAQELGDSARFLVLGRAVAAATRTDRGYSARAAAEALVLDLKAGSRMDSLSMAGDEVRAMVTAGVGSVVQEALDGVVERFSTQLAERALRAFVPSP